MTLKQAPSYWLECDGEGCKNRYPNQYDEVTSWGQPDHLADGSSEDDWKESHGDTHYCDACWIYCGHCDATGDNPEPNTDGERQKCRDCDGRVWIPKAKENRS